MLVRSAIFSQMTGKFNGAVAMEGRVGTAVRAHVIPANPNSSAQQQVRNALRQVTSLFFGSTLTAAQREEWAAYAAGETLVGRTGVAYRPTASQAFVAVNAIRVQMGWAAVLTPPPHGYVPAAVTFSWEGGEIITDYPVPPAGTPDAYALGGGLRLYVARRPVFHARRYGSWDAVATVLGAAVRPDSSGLSAAVGEQASGMKAFYRLVGSAPTGQPIAAIEGMIIVA